MNAIENQWLLVYQRHSITMNRLNLKIAAVHARKARQSHRQENFKMNFKMSSKSLTSKYVTSTVKKCIRNIWDVPFEIRFFFAILRFLTNIMNNVVLDFSQKIFFDCFKIILKMT
jgi:hypothetical protein